jgi:hypothetical protein
MGGNRIEISLEKKRLSDGSAYYELKTSDMTLQEWISTEYEDNYPEALKNLEWGKNYYESKGNTVFTFDLSHED